MDPKNKLILRFVITLVIYLVFLWVVMALMRFFDWEGDLAVFFIATVLAVLAGIVVWHDGGDDG
jgi:hypothetical protein